jgi:hypothetical protein
MQSESPGQLLNLEVQAVYDAFAVQVGYLFGLYADGAVDNADKALARFEVGLARLRECRRRALAAVRESQPRED